MRKGLRTFLFFTVFITLWLQLDAATFRCEPSAVYLSWQGDPQTTMTIQWITMSRDQETFVRYRELDGTQWYSINGRKIAMPQKKSQVIHVVELTDLKPGASYYFQVGKHPQQHKFQTISDDPNEPIRFVVGGDVLHDSVEIFKETNHQAAATHPHFGLIGGDIAYGASKSLWKPQKWANWMKFVEAWSQTMITPDGYKIPILPVLGNHDITGRYGQPKYRAPFYYTLFATPQRRGYFALDFGKNLSIIGLDSGHSNEITGPQSEWLEKMLEERRNVPHKFAFYHVPAYPSVRSFTSKRIVPVRENWVPIFEKYGLTAAFEHHDHAYKRTHRIYQDNVDPEQGVLYIGDGAWGVEAPRPTKQPEDVWYLAKTASARHFILVNVEGERRSFTAIDSKGNVVDHLEERVSVPVKLTRITFEEAIPSPD